MGYRTVRPMLVTGCRTLEFYSNIEHCYCSLNRWRVAVSDLKIWMTGRLHPLYVARLSGSFQLYWNPQTCRNQRIDLNACKPNTVNSSGRIKPPENAELESTRRLFKTNETSRQNMTILQNQNTRGLLTFKDELTALLVKWAKEDEVLTKLSIKFIICTDAKPRTTWTAVNAALSPKKQPDLDFFASEKWLNVTFRPAFI